MDGPATVAHCVSGQLRGLFDDARRVDRLVAPARVDRFAVLGKTCQPGVCVVDDGAVRAWAARVRVVRLVVLPDASNGSTDLEATPRRPPACGVPPLRRAAFMTSFYHQHAKEAACFALVRAHERRRRAAYAWYVHTRADFSLTHARAPSGGWDPRRIYFYDSCHVADKAPVLCDGLWIASRRHAALLFRATDGWTRCDAYAHRWPCHEPSGEAPECLLSAWLVDHGVPRAAWSIEGELGRMGVLRAVKRTPNYTSRPLTPAP